MRHIAKRDQRHREMQQREEAFRKFLESEKKTLAKQGKKG